MIGQVVGKCRLESIIGAGAMGEVYRAQHTTLKIPVAVKLIKPEIAADDELVARFHREARLAARLKHPNVVRIFDVGRDNEINYIVMELLSGPTLEEMLGRHGPLDTKTFFALFHPLASGLAQAHKLGIVHRDLKPSNVVIVDRKKPVLTDFGIAGALAQDSRLTAPGHLLGTPAYMSPEQARGDATLDSRTDIFAMGVMMVEALTGRLPQYSDNMLELIARRVSETIPPVASLNVKISPEIARVVDTAVARNPSRRFADAGALVAALAEAYKQIFPSAAEQASATGSLASQERFNGRLRLPREGSTPIADPVDLRYVDLFNLLRAAETSQTGFGVISMQYQDGADVMLFSDGALTIAAHWTAEGFTQASYDDVVNRFATAPNGQIEAAAVGEDLYRALKAVLTLEPAVSGMRAEFVDFLALLEHLGRNGTSGVVRIEHAGTLGLVPFANGRPGKPLVEPWFAGTGRRPGTAPLSDLLGQHPEARIDVFEYSKDALATADDAPSEPSIEDQEVDSLFAFVGEALSSSGSALEKEFGLGSRPILEKHLRAAAMDNPAVLEGVNLDDAYSVDYRVLKARIAELPRTGRRRAVLSAAESLIRERGLAIADALGNPRKRKKAIKPLLNTWSKYERSLDADGMAASFGGLFTDLANGR